MKTIKKDITSDRDYKKGKEMNENKSPNNSGNDNDTSKIIEDSFVRLWKVVKWISMKKNISVVRETLRC